MTITYQWNFKFAILLLLFNRFYASANVFFYFLSMIIDF